MRWLAVGVPFLAGCPWIGADLAKDRMDGDGDGVAWPADCDDDDPDVNPGAVESCDGIDNDCNGEVDEAGAVGERTWYRDADGDVYGNDLAPRLACDRPQGFVAVAGDCDDDIDEVNPGATEICGDGLDNDCGYDPFACALTGSFDLSGADAWGVGTHDSDGYGMRLASGDYNADGVMDLAVAAPFAQELPEGFYSGAVYVFFGPIPADLSAANADAVVIGIQEYAYFGWQLVTLPDIDGDGGDELLVSAPFLGDNYEGGVFLVRSPLPAGRSSADAFPYERGDAYYYLGYSLDTMRGPGGQARVVVAAPGAPWGEVFVFHDPNATIAPDQADVKLTGDSTCATAYVVANAGDLSGDGVDDLFLANPYCSLGADYNGVVDLISGTTTGEVLVADVLRGRILGVEAYDEVGLTLLAGGYADSDSVLDAWVGSPNVSATPGADPIGAMHMVSGWPEGVLAADGLGASLWGVEPYAQFGVSAASLDINGDGWNDVLVGASGASHPERSYVGAAYLFYGPITADRSVAEADAVLWGAESSEDAGWSVAVLDDLNGDGVPELAVGAPQLSSGGAGKVYVIHGSAE